MTIHVEPIAPSAEAPVTPAERLHPISRRLVAGALAAGIGVAGVVAIVRSEPVQKFIENPIDAVMDPLFPPEPSFNQNSHAELGGRPLTPTDQG